MTLPEPQVTITVTPPPQAPISVGRTYSIKEVDRKALTAAVKAPEAWYEALELGDKMQFNVNHFAIPGKGKWYQPDLRSMLYSMQAHLRGHLHGTKKFNPTFSSTGGHSLDERSMEDQLDLIGDRWELFLPKGVRPPPLDPHS